MLRVSTRTLRVVVLGLVAAALLGCRADLVAPIELTADGGATVGLAVRFDARMLAELDALGVDPTAELGAVVTEDPRWTLERIRDDQGGLTVTVLRQVADAREVGAVYRDLTAGLASTDPSLALEVDVEVLDDGSQRVTGTAVLRPPVTSGLEVDGEPIGDGAEDLAALVEEHVTAAVELRFAAPVETHDGVRLDRSSVRFDLEPGQTRSLTAVAGPPSWWARLDLDLTTALLLAGGVVVVLGAGLLLAGRRRVTPGA